MILSLIWFLNFQSNHDLTVNITNIKEPQGQLIMAIFDSEDTFLEKPFQSKKIEVSGESQKVVFKNLPAGHYSVSIIYDENNNGELDKNMIGIPKEGFAFSRKSMGTFGPPSYDDTKVEVKDNDVSIDIPLKYM